MDVTWASRMADPKEYVMNIFCVVTDEDRSIALIKKVLERVGWIIPASKSLRCHMAQKEAIAEICLQKRRYRILALITIRCFLP